MYYCFIQLYSQTEENNPNDIAYVYAMYAPVSIRLVQHAFNPGWKPFAEVIKELPGPAFEEIQQLPAGAQEGNNVPINPQF